MQEGTVLQVQVRTFNLMDLKSMRDLNPTDLDKLIAVKGMITRTGAVLPDLKEGFFRCGACAAEMRVQIDRGRIAEPAICENCNTRGAMELIHNRCWFADKQVNKLQETPESIPDGETPATVSIYAYDTLVDVAKPGDRVVVTGIYRASPVRPNSFQRTTHAIYRTCTYLACYTLIRFVWRLVLEAVAEAMRLCFRRGRAALQEGGDEHAGRGRRGGHGRGGQRHHQR